MNKEGDRITVFAVRVSAEVGSAVTGTVRGGCASFVAIINGSCVRGDTCVRIIAISNYAQPLALYGGNIIGLLGLLYATRYDIARYTKPIAV